MKIKTTDEYIYFGVGEYYLGFLRLSDGQLYHIKIIKDNNCVLFFNTGGTRLFVKIIRDFVKLNKSNTIIFDAGVCIDVKEDLINIYTNNTEKKINNIKGLSPNATFTENEVHLMQKIVNKYWETQYSFEKIVRDNRQNKLNRILN